MNEKRNGEKRWARWFARTGTPRSIMSVDKFVAEFIGLLACIMALSKSSVVERRQG
jgi:hypothetical protein